MIRGRFDSSYYHNPKVLRAGRDARDLHFGAIQYATRCETDGFIPDAVVADLDPFLGPRKSRESVEKLVENSLFSRVPGGYQVNDFLEFQSSRDEAEELRNRTRERVRRHRERKRNADGNALQTALQDEGVTLHRRNEKVRQQQVPKEETAPKDATAKGPSAPSRARDPEPELEPGDDEPSGSAAAARHPTDTEILNACRRFGADRDIVFPIAEQTTAADLADITTKVERKIARNRVDDVPALFVHLLRRAPRLEQPAELQPVAIATPAPEPVERVPLEKALELNVRRLAENGRDWPTVETFVRDAFGDDHIDQARAVYDDAATEPGAVA